MKSFLEETFHQKRVLITGGLGFIGSNLARRLLQFDARVTIVDNLAPNYGGNPYNLHGIEQDVHTIIADICDKAQVGDILPQQDFLFNLAAQISHLGSMQDPSDDLEAERGRSVDPAGDVPPPQPSHPGSSTLAPARFMGVRSTSPSTNSIRSSRWILMGSANWRGNGITGSATRSTNCVRAACG